jgi:hypothetical protein
VLRLERSTLTCDAVASKPFLITFFNRHMLFPFHCYQPLSRLSYRTTCTLVLPRVHLLSVSYVLVQDILLFCRRIARRLLIFQRSYLYASLSSAKVKGLHGVQRVRTRKYFYVKQSCTSYLVKCCDPSSLEFIPCSEVHLE